MKTNPTRITLATIKAFIRKAGADLHIACGSKFDGMVDCVMPTGDKSFGPALPAEYKHENNLGIAGVWFVFGSRDYFTAFERDGFRGFHVSNCCGSFDVAVPVAEV